MNIVARLGRYGKEEGTPTRRKHEAMGGSIMAAEAAAREIIEGTVRAMAAGHAGVTRYREPVFGYAGANDPAWRELRDRHVPGHLLPSDVLPGAQSVACFFLPFSREIVLANARARVCADEWALAYLETNALLAGICRELQSRLEKAGVRSAWQRPTHNYDPALLRSTWSHKSAAVIAGMGTFGLHQMLITERGCAGRVSSIVVDVNLAGSAGPALSRQTGDGRPAAGSRAWDRPPSCGFLAGKICNACMKRCPVSAITEHGVDKQACQHRLNEVAAYFAKRTSIPGQPVPGKVDACGKCATGPCALAPCPGTGRRS